MGAPQVIEGVREFGGRKSSCGRRLCRRLTSKLTSVADRVASHKPELPDRPRYIVCDRDSKFPRQFREILKDDDLTVVQTGVRAPNQNAYAERWAQSLRRECLDHFIAFGEKHPRYLVQGYVRYYN